MHGPVVYLFVIVNTAVNIVVTIMKQKGHRLPYVHELLHLMLAFCQ